MTSEQDLHAYILMGNALHYLLNATPLDYHAELQTSRDTLQDLHRTVEPLKPADLLTTLRELPAPQRALLERCCRWCIANLGTEFGPLIGLSPEEAAAVLESFSPRTPP